MNELKIVSLKNVEAKFKTGQKVITPKGLRIIVSHYTTVQVEGVFVPQYQVAPLNRHGGIDMRVLNRRANQNWDNLFLETDLKEHEL